MNKIKLSYVVQCVVFAGFLACAYSFGKSSNATVFDKITVKTLEVTGGKNHSSIKFEAIGDFCTLTFLNKNNKEMLSICSDKEDTFIEIYGPSGESLSLSKSYLQIIDNNNTERLCLSIDESNNLPSIVLSKKSGDIGNSLTIKNPY